MIVDNSHKVGTEVGDIIKGAPYSYQFDVSAHVSAHVKYTSLINFGN